MAGYEVVPVALSTSTHYPFGVFSPAFKSCEKSFATHQFANNDCNFLKNDCCEFYGTGHQPLECRYCHHERRSFGLQVMQISKRLEGACQSSAGGSMDQASWPKLLHILKDKPNAIAYCERRNTCQQAKNIQPLEKKWFW